MKKLKLILPIICSGTTLLTATTALTGCKDPQHETNYLYLTNGDTHLISGVTRRGVAHEGQAYHAWKAVDENGKEVKDVYYDIMPLSEGDFNHIHVGVSSGIVYWDSTTPVGNYKFKVVAAYDKDGTTVRAVSDVVTLEVTRQTKVKIPEGKDATCNLLSTNDGTYFELKGFEIVNFTPTDYFLDYDLNFEVEEIDGEELGDFTVYPYSEITDYQRSYIRFNVCGYFENDNLAVGDHKLKVNITDLRTANPYVYNQEFTVHSSFSTDSWENLGKQSAKGLDHLKKYYGVDSFVGMTKTVMVNGLKHRVLVVGENEDVDANGQKVPLTFQFINAISEKVIIDGDPYYLPLATHWNKNRKTDKANYWESNINKALNEGEDPFNDWYYFVEEDWSLVARPSINTNSVLKMLPQGLQSNLKSIKRKVVCEVEDSYKVVEQSTKVFLPSLNSFFSDKGIQASKGGFYDTDAKKQNFMSENDQYSFYANEEIIGDTDIYNEDWSPVPYSLFDLSFITAFDNTISWYDVETAAWPIALASASQMSSSEALAWHLDYDTTGLNYIGSSFEREYMFVTPMFGI